MMNWEQTDKLHEIATNTAIPADQRKSDIEDFMREWGELVQSRATLPTNAATYAIPTIDPYGASKSNNPRPDYPDVPGTPPIVMPQTHIGHMVDTGWRPAFKTHPRSW